MGDELDRAIHKALAGCEKIPEELKASGFGVLLAHYLGIEDSGGTVAPPTEGLSGGDELPATLPEFIALKKPKTHPQYVTCFAYFVFKSGDATGLTIREVEQAYQEIRQKKPQNLSDVIASCVGRGRGWVIQAPQDKNRSKAWVVTRVGEEAVEGGFKTS